MRLIPQPLLLCLGLALVPACGQTSTSDMKLVGGQAVSGSATTPFPASVFLKPGCGAVKVGSKRFLTTARCVSRTSVLRFDTAALRTEFTSGGSFELTAHKNPSETTNAWTKVTVSKTTVHPQFGRLCADKTKCQQLDIARGGGDLAVIEVNEATPSIPVAKLDLAYQTPGSAVTVMGYGCETGTLTPAETPARFKSQATTIGERKASASAGAPLLGMQELVFWNLPTVGIATDSSRASLCKQDYGSPLYKGGSDDTVVAINSYASFDIPSRDNVGRALYNFHTRLDLAKDWLQTFTWEGGILQNATSRVKWTPASNSRNQPAGNVAFADADADGEADVLTFSGQEIRVHGNGFHNPIKITLNVEEGVKRIITGDFNADKYDNVCAITVNNNLKCYGISTDKKALWWWWSQGNFIADNEDFVVGDFDGDARDDLMVYNSTNGDIRFYGRQGQHFFSPITPFALGNLEGAKAPGWRFYARRVAASARSHLIGISPQGQVVYYANVFDGTNNTFWWAWTSNGFIPASSQVTTARIDDDDQDDLVVRDLTTGKTDFYSFEYNGGNPPTLSQPTGQIHIEGNSLIYFSSFHGNFLEPGMSRNDAVVYTPYNNSIHRADARWSGTEFTYWWAYSNGKP